MSDERASLLSAAETKVSKALSVAPSHAVAHLVLGAVLIATKRAARGIDECARALALDRNVAEAHAQIGTAKYLTGHGAETEAHMNEAFRLSPRDIFAHRWLMTVGFAKLQLGSDAEALQWFLRSIEANRNHALTHFGLAAALALLGSLDEARAAARVGLTLVPSFTLRRFRDGAQTDHPSYLARRERVHDGLRMAGVPEG